MAVLSAGRGGAGISQDSTEYWDAFRRDVFLLLVMGYKRLASAQYSTSEEPDITGELVKAIRQVTEDPTSPQVQMQLEAVREKVGKAEKENRYPVRVDRYPSSPSVLLRGQEAVEEKPHGGIPRTERNGRVPRGQLRERLARGGDACICTDREPVRMGQENLQCDWETRGCLNADSGWPMDEGRYDCGVAAHLPYEA